MQEDEYYKKSSERSLPLRCPILNYCRRRAWTIYLFSEYSKYDPHLNMLQALQKDGTLPEDYEEKEINCQGESPSIIRGSDYYYFSNACPEVNLFEKSNALISGQACTQGSYDESYREEKIKIHKTGHFSECAEFNKFLFDNNRLTGKKKSKRKTVPYKTKALLQKEINSICPFCENVDVDHFQIHHIDENSENNSKDNLLMLCPTCHSKITKGDITMKQVENCKMNLKN